MTRKVLGQMGENLAAYALEQRGFKVLAKNVYTRFGEIDLIVKKNNHVLFVEVKTRTNRAYGFPEEAINDKKRLHLTRSAQILNTKFAHGLDWSLVAISVELNLKNKLAHLRCFALDA